MKQDLANITSIYFLGIGGIGMSALARYFIREGKQVAGYDKTPTALIQTLTKEGAEVIFSDAIEALPKTIDPKNTLVVYTPAVASTNSLFTYFNENGYSIKKRAEVLGMITRGTHTLAVAGTHGKTTTTAILAHLLHESGVKFTAFLGGISENFHSNFISTGTAVVVVEADEFDRSFLQLQPNQAAITSMDADHLDIYKDAANLEASFKEFADKLPTSSKILIKEGLPINGTSISVEGNGGINISNIRVVKGYYQFDFDSAKVSLKNLKFTLPGRHNLFNAAVALAMAIDYGVSADSLAKALPSFKGVDRRFTYHLHTADKVLIEDYAHHPKEIDAVCQALAEMHPDKESVVVFQPHLFSRTQDFMDDFARSLSAFSTVILLDIYPAREEPIAGVNSEALLSKISSNQKLLLTKENLVQNLLAMKPQLVALLGAGDIGNLAEPLKKAWQNEV